MTRSLRFWSFVAPSVAVLVLGAGLLRAEGPAPAPPLSPPATRAIYRSYWFDLLNALHENDAAAVPAALEAMTRAARASGIERLSEIGRAHV